MSPGPCWSWPTGVSGQPGRPTRSPRPRRPDPGAVAVPPGSLPLSPAAIGAVVGASLPEGAVIVDEAITASLGLAAGTAAAPPHDWLSLTGGAIGQGLPVATGAAVAAPDGGRSAWRPTGAPCTRSRPCGPRPARAST